MFLAIASLMLDLAAGQNVFADPCTPCTRKGPTFFGRVRYAGDGDSLCVGQSRDPSTWIEIKVSDIYSLELHSPGRSQAKVLLQRIAMG